MLELLKYVLPNVLNHVSDGRRAVCTVQGDAMCG